LPRHYPNWLKAYCSFTSASEAPLDFHFWTGVSTLAAVLRKRVWKDEHSFKWTPNFYIVFVGPAGIVTKSTTLNIGYRLLANLPDLGSGNYPIIFGPDSMTWHGLAKKFEAAYHEIPLQLASGDIIKVKQSALTCSVSELGTFLRPEDKALMSFLTDIWDGKERPFDHATKDSGQIQINGGWLNIIGATTPFWMQSNFPPTMLQEGIGSRIVFVYGDKKRHLTAYPSRVVKSSDYYDNEKRLTDDLAHISRLIGPYELTEDAYVWGEEWYKKHNSTRSLHTASGRYSGYLARKQTHMHKLAMVLSASQRDKLLIEQSDLEQANAILEAAEHSMIQVFESVGTSRDSYNVGIIVEYVRAYKWITSEELYRLVFNIMERDQYKAAISNSVEGGLLEVVRKEGKLGLSPKAKIVN